ncbi:zinc finger and BTB domain-containing protein 49-like [Lampris incognitus]|uniref:zinc finger and BTB domain-containing protein 49-like n=1 Tax=Lampris incognitus TaxID=2546036 RepID=UPI0024B4998A|nr:zinc finger and BTB domain-containing protein 49-like [Lampris incognitus]
MAEASCSSFPFARKPYGDLQDEMISQQQYRSSDTLLISSDGTVHSSLHGMEGPSLNHQQPRRSGYFQVVKPKKSFVCSYCSKVFERVGHLERHLRIHTGEKPYGCHICGRCFNQKSSLKGHMKTHINGESKALLEAHHLVYKMHEEQQSANPIVCKTELPTLEEQRPGSGYSERGIEQVLIVKVEPEGEGFRTLNQSVDEHGTGTLDQNQLWTLEMETSDDTASPIPGCSNASTNAADGVSRSVEYHLSPVCREETHHLAKERLS